MVEGQEGKPIPKGSFTSAALQLRVQQQDTNFEARSSRALSRQRRAVDALVWRLSNRATAVFETLSTS